MGYKLLGYVVWQGAKWYLRRRYPNAPRNLAIASVASVVVAGVAVAAVRSRSGD